MTGQVGASANDSTIKVTPAMIEVGVRVLQVKLGSQFRLTIGDEYFVFEIFEQMTALLPREK